ncbi:MAG: hypothetical protein RLZZ488_827 [Pseudomonadota bacterium]
MSANPHVSAARRICQVLRQSGHTAFWVGGAVRDLLLSPKTTPKDIDIATDAAFDEVRRLFPHTRAIGKAFGVGLVSDGVFSFEVATFRKESDYADRRHPSFVGVGSMAEDSDRRDFTINALYFDPIDETIVDFHGGLDDLQNRIIRCVGRPEIRLHEDPLRILRLYRFAGNLGFHIAEETDLSAKSLSAELKYVSKERVILEISKLRAESIPQFTESLRPFLNSLIGKAEHGRLSQGEPDKTSIQKNSVALNNPGMLFALMCAANEGFASRNWPQTFKSWPFSLEEKAQLEFFQRMGDHRFSLPDTADEHAWRKFLEAVRWLQRQARLTADVFLWLCSQSIPSTPDEELFLQKLHLHLQSRVNSGQIAPTTPFSEALEALIRSKAAPLREKVCRGLNGDTAGPVTGLARLLVDSSLLLNEIGLSNALSVSFLSCESDEKIASLRATAMRWSGLEPEKTKN